MTGKATARLLKHRLPPPDINYCPGATLCLRIYVAFILIFPSCQPTLNEQRLCQRPPLATTEITA